MKQARSERVGACLHGGSYDSFQPGAHHDSRIPPAGRNGDAIMTLARVLSRSTDFRACGKPASHHARRQVLDVTQPSPLPHRSPRTRFRAPLPAPRLRPPSSTDPGSSPSLRRSRVPAAFRSRAPGSHLVLMPHSLRGARDSSSTPRFAAGSPCWLLRCWLAVWVLGVGSRCCLAALLSGAAQWFS